VPTFTGVLVRIWRMLNSQPLMTISLLCRGNMKKLEMALRFMY
jgi:hypothetical protein